MATPQEAVDHAASLFSDAEAAIQKAIDKLNAMPKDFKAVHMGGLLELPDDVEQFGYLESNEYSARARAIAGSIAMAQESLFMFHRDCTARARELGLDTPGVMGGGGR